MLHEAAGMNLPEVRMRVLKRRRDPAAVNSRLIRRPIQRMFWLFLLPMTAAFCIGFVYPFLKGLFLSFCKFKTTSKWTWVGLSNYVKAFHDESFLYSFGYTAVFAIVSLIIINVLAFAVAYALTQGIKGTNVFRTVFFMPNLIGGIVLGYIWSMIFDGILSHYGTSILLNTKLGFWGLIILMCWQQIGYMMIIYIAGLQAVPEDMLEAAKIDGASAVRTFFSVTLPLLIPSLTINVTQAIIGGFRVFEQVLTLTDGGPGHQSTVVSMMVYEYFGRGFYGKSTAISMMLSVIVLFVTLAVRGYFNKKAVSY